MTSHGSHTTFAIETPCDSPATNYECFYQGNQAQPILPNIKHIDIYLSILFCPKYRKIYKTSLR